MPHVPVIASGGGVGSNIETETAKFGDVAGGNYAEFESDGTLVFVGDATVWDDQQVSVHSVKLPGSQAPSWTDYKGSQVLAFAGGATNKLYFAAQLTHRYQEGSDLEFHIHYAPETATAGNVNWVFTHSWASIGEVLPGETTVNKTLATPEVADQHTLGEIAATIDGTGKKISSCLLCYLERDGGADTYNDIIYLISLDFHVKMDTVGSRQEAVK